MRVSRIPRWPLVWCIATVAVVGAAGTVVAQDPNLCDEAGDEPDVIVGDIPEIERWGSFGAITAFSIGTTSCNVGTCWLSWDSSTRFHPVISQNLFRWFDGRFEHIGQAWLKHGFFAVNGSLCSSECVETNGDHLGVNCSDPYDAMLNGSQGGLGPKFEVNASTGEFAYPPSTGDGIVDLTSRRLRVATADLDPAVYPGARYVVEGMYVTPDDAAAGNALNNASYREATVSAVSNGFTLVPTGSTQSTFAGLFAWTVFDEGVRLVTRDVPDDGRYVFASKVTDQGDGTWRYEYAVQNQNSHRSGRSFRVPLPPGATVTAVGFHDVDYHSGEPWDGTDWAANVQDDGVHPPAIVWSTETIDVNPDANALRWGTLYNFRFTVDAPPRAGFADVTLGLFRPGSPPDVSAALHVPQVCDGDGVCDAGEDCVGCPADCGALQTGFCGNGTCELDLGEDCVSCPEDCAGAQSGSPGNRYCCGDGDGEAPVGCTDPRCTADGAQCVAVAEVVCCGDDTCVGAETPCGCPVDCGPCDEPCALDEDCDDGSFCTGVEQCADGACVAGTDPCPGQACDDVTAQCFDCVIGSDCDDGEFCTGFEDCADYVCLTGADPCAGGLCDDGLDACVECLTDADCDDGDFCTGVETCSAGACVPGSDPCPDPDEPCDEDADVCIPCLIECDDGQFCNGFEQCVSDVCLPAVTPCPGRPCDEVADTCLGTAVLQPAAGRPYRELSVAESDRFAAGLDAFEAAVAAADGLGPAYNGASCAACHAGPTGGGGTQGITLFGASGSGTFDPLTGEGGPLLQSLALSPECAEVVPAGADVTAVRVPTALFGAGLVEAVDDADIEARAIAPPAGVSGRINLVPAHEVGGALRVGRYGSKAQGATVPSTVAESARDHLGVTTRLLPAEHAPGGDPSVLAACDAVADPEDAADPGGLDRLDRWTDYARLLAPPPQTPLLGMSGEVFFSLASCDDCHTRQFVARSDGDVEPVLRGRQLRPYSDFLLHDMGDSGDGIMQGDAATSEQRTAPLWGLRHRDALWHDGRFAGGTLDQRVRDAIAAHDAPGSEAAASAQQFASLPSGGQAALVTFLGSLGRRPFDADGDGDVDAADFAAFEACYLAGGSVTPNQPCAVSDPERDGDVDLLDYEYFLLAFDGTYGGRVPDGAQAPGEPLRVERGSGGDVVLSWDPSCGDDDDYAVYSAPLATPATLRPLTCSTGGATSATVTPPAGDRVFLVVPHNGLTEGSYGLGADDGERAPPGPFACLSQHIGACP